MGWVEDVRVYGFGCKGLEFKVLASRVPGFGVFSGRVL